MSIFVAVGTSHFDSLIGKMDELAPRLGEKVVMQIGLGRIQPRNAEYFRFAPSLQPYIDEASIVISHGGFGVMTEALSRGKPVIGVENTDMYDNHQTELLEQFAEEEYILWCRTMDDLEAAIREAPRRTFRPYAKPESTIGARIRKFLDETARDRR
jgi:beta-1,4-N-acetylglucosaminyltransferase